MKRNHRPGIILLVVLSTLTFFSLLVAAYLVFSRQAQQSSFAIASRSIKQPEPNALLNQALMKIIRGTGDTSDPFFGEDMLSDYYGRTDAMSLSTKAAGVALGTGFAEFTVESTTAPDLNDIFAGRVMTFRDGPEVNRTFRIVRSIHVTGDDHKLIIQVEPDMDVTTIPTGTTVWLNGIPRNSLGFGFQSGAFNNVVQEAEPQPNLGAAGTIGFTMPGLPAALQPNHFARTVNKGAIIDRTTDPTKLGSDFDEAYDAADFNNWFLSYRYSDGTVIPSFHRPSVLNYILNQVPDWTSASNTEFANAIVAISRATFRPLPFAEGQLWVNTTTSPTTRSAAINQHFTGGSSEFALRTPLLLRSGGEARLDQVARALIDGSWDVDNDSDGTPDSIWIDLGLPLITSPEGKLLKPLIAPMIEDLSGRLNINAHHNPELAATTAALQSSGALWAGSRAVFDPTLPANNADVYRGLGYGPAEIALPETDLAALVNQRYQDRAGASVAIPKPGQDIADQLDVVRTGPRPPIHEATSGYGYSSDPFGRGGTALGRSGQLVAANSGTRIHNENTATTQVIEAMDESVNDPYESDPTGRLSGDALFTHDELEAILRSNEFDRDLLPDRLDAQLQTLLQSSPEIARSLTTISVSDDTPSILGTDTNIPSTFKTFRDRFPTVPDTGVDELVAPEIRLGNKIDVNRPFGNGVDDDTDGVIDEPGETETEAFDVAPSSGQMVPTAFQGQAPNYQFGETVTGRELLARHLYVLMMTLTNGYTFPVIDTSMSAADRTHYRARRIAQWAVNVVDYRDPDSIMTRFVFDPNPFDASGWAPDPTMPKNIVWGVEAPELVFSESAAFHDVRVRDTTHDDGPGDTKDTSDPTDPNLDPHTDQVRMPQGSLFLELYCPRAPVSVNGTVDDQSSQQAAPQELYDIAANGTSLLDLDAVAPNGVPVWRIALSAPHPAPVAGAVAGNAPFAGATEDPETLRTTTYQDSASFEPSHPNELDGTAPAVALDRFIWFRDFSTPADIGTVTALIDAADGMTQNNVFFLPSVPNSPLFGGSTNYSVSPGQFLTISPRQVTNLGSEVFATLPTKPSDHRFVTTAGQGAIQFRHTGVAGGQRTTPTPLSTSNPAWFPPAQPMIASTFRPTAYPASVFENGLVGLNVSEPLPNVGTYYGAAAPTLRYGGTTNADYGLTDAYIDLSAPTNTALDEPLDPAFGRIPDSSASPGEPFLGTVPRYCSAFLQRLANPLVAYDPVTNPYRTVDWITIDLTIFSGEGPAGDVMAGTEYARRTRQRNGEIGGTGQNALFSYETTLPGDEPESLAPEVAGAPYFSFAGNGPLYNSFSFLNSEVPTINPSNPPAVAASFGFGLSIGRDAMATAVSGTDRGLPQVPYAIHPWLNRPFASELELLMVPACSQGRLFEEFGVVPGSAAPTIFPTDPASLVQFHGNFRHLLNFFHSDKASGDAAEFVRFFDFVHTRPPFRGEVEMINPANVTGDLLPMLAAPFSYSYNNQRQGQINLNTLAEFPVWQGLMQGHMNATEFANSTGTTKLAFDTFIDNRRGFTPTALRQVTVAGPSYNYDATHLNPLYPTQFAGAFRDSMTTPFTPLLRGTMAEQEALRRRPVNGTLLRGFGTLDASDPDRGGAATVGSQFVRGDSEAPTWNMTAMPPTTPHLDRNRNPWMRYQTLMRMPNLGSDNSQVFLIRMTLGYFEVDATDVDSVGAEHKEVIGENERYRAMFIVDRSIPVGFVPGEDTNARNTVIFERFDQ